MTVLGDAVAIGAGDAPAEAIYLGDALVWSAEPSPWGPRERMLDSTPPTEAPGLGAPYTLGARFTVTTAGRITHVRYYAVDVSFGAFTVAVWDTLSGTVLASAADAPTAVGWREVALPAPLDVAPGVSYTASFSGNAYANTPSTPQSLTPNLVGLTGYYAPGLDTFPGSSAGSYHYHVDVVYQQSIAVRLST